MERWEIGNEVLEFDEATHTYWCNGQKCISVTQLLKKQFPKKYEGISKEVLDRAAAKGTFVHETIEMYEKYGLEATETQEFRDYMFLKNQFKFKVLDNELPIILKYKELIVAGRLDMVLQEKGKTGLGDIKCTATLDKEYLAYQLNLYKLGYEQCYGEQVEILRALHLKNGARRYVTIPINESAVIELLENYRKEVNKNE